MLETHSEHKDLSIGTNYLVIKLSERTALTRIVLVEKYIVIGKCKEKLILKETCKIINPKNCNKTPSFTFK